MTKEEQALPKLKYREFVTFAKRYERENKRKDIKEKYANPYKYVRVFKKGKKNES